MYESEDVSVSEKPEVAVNTDKQYDEETLGTP